MKIFVSGASGFQGGNIAQELIKNGHEITTVTRGQEEDKLPGIFAVTGGLEDKEALKKALEGVATAVYTFPLIFDIDLAKAYTSNFIEAAKEQGVSLVVFNAGFDLPNAENGLLAMDLKVAVKELLDVSGLKVTTLVPDVYIDNLAAPWSVPVILNEGVLPYPVAAGNKIPWISHVDLAKYVAAAVDKPELAGQTLPVGGNVFSGEEIATAISAEIGKTVHYVGLTPDAFEQQISPTFGALAGREISNLYRYVEQEQKSLVNKDFKKTQELLAVTPQPLSEWVKSINWEMPSN